MQMKQHIWSHIFGLGLTKVNGQGIGLVFGLTLYGFGLRLIIHKPDYIKWYILAEGREQMYEVVWLSFVHQTNDGARASKRSSQHGLKQRMWCDLYDNGVVWNVLEGLLEQHRTH